MYIDIILLIIFSILTIYIFIELFSIRNKLKFILIPFFLSLPIIYYFYIEVKLGYAVSLDIIKEDKCYYIANFTIQEPKIIYLVLFNDETYRLYKTPYYKKLHEELDKYGNRKVCLKKSNKYGNRILDDTLRFYILPPNIPNEK